MNLEQYAKLINLLRDNGFQVDQKYHSFQNSEMTFGKIIDTDDKDIKLIIEGSFHYRIHEDKKTKKDEQT